MVTVTLEYKIINAVHHLADGRFYSTNHINATGLANGGGHAEQMDSLKTGQTYQFIVVMLGRT